ncbi:MAG: eukaryotic-like serine/threonine-protein kinase [Acidobacteriota bacterium]|jgi:tetratricopeptide (TPR) repeat protein/predicted Ser/Thr protein kinase|nr:eukaryotic-like serine/threonine-protein kinase [Acidobacteriota bacterium]
MVGRYVVLERIGAGGMGVVYAAYDPELDRKVALKLLRPDRAGAAGEAALRLQREAQAIARLSDPHVVAVYDAGTLGEQVFVAMEFVEGRTLREWLKAEPRSWSEILKVFLAAGWGLAAAHDAGLVHRDFKPDNVLLGTDGRIKVADFGLARPVGDADPGGGEAALMESPGSRGLLATPLTEWGVAMGTPAYMAPEQLRGERADARSDQFSFCVALWEALYGRKPFAGESFREMLDAERRGEIVEPPAGTGVPARILPILRRGLAVSPEARYPGMAELLHDLERDPSVVRRRWLALAAVVLVTGAIFAGLGYFQARRAELCGGVEEKLAGVWDEPRKQAVHAAFLATGVPFAEDAWKIVGKSVDRYTSDWTGMRRQACEATRLRGEQSEDLLDRRMLCLDQHLQDAAAVTKLFTQADAQIVGKAVASVSALPPVADCADVESLRAKLPPPRDPKLRARVEAARALVSEARALHGAGKRPEGLAKAVAAEKQARPLGYGPLEAEALFEKGFLQDVMGDFKAAEETLFDALTAAQASGHQEVAAQSASQLSWVTGHEQTRPADGEKWARLAQSIADGARGGPGLRSELLVQQSAIRAKEARYQEAIELATRALALAEQAGRDNPRIPSILNDLAEYQDQTGRYEEALRNVHRSLEIRAKTLPPDHPDFANAYNTLGNIESNQNRQAEAAAAFEHAIAIERKQYGPKHWLVGGGLMGLATAHQALGHLDLALRYDRESLDIMKGYGPESPNVAAILVNIGEVLRLQGKPAEALDSYRRALAMQEKTLGADNPNLAFPLSGIARVLPQLGRAAQAIAPAERAVRLFETGQGDPRYLSQARYILAVALWDGGGDRGRAARLAREARSGLEKTGAKDEQQEVEAWLKQKGLSG